MSSLFSFISYLPCFNPYYLPYNHPYFLLYYIPYYIPYCLPYSLPYVFLVGRSKLSRGTRNLLDKWKSHTSKSVDTGITSRSRLSTIFTIFTILLFPEKQQFYKLMETSPVRVSVVIHCGRHKMHFMALQQWYRHKIFNLYAFTVLLRLMFLLLPTLQKAFFSVLSDLLNQTKVKFFKRYILTLCKF
jgi:hypothetical protein